MNIKADKEKLTEAFDHMVEDVSKMIHEAEEAMAPSIDEMVQNAQILARDIYALSQEEAENLGDALKRDMEKAHKTLNQQGKELKDWWSFDLQLVEDRFIEMIARAADKTWLDFRAFEYKGRQSNLYHSGDVCNAGTLGCNRCDNRIQLKKTSRIPPCPECQHDEFYRITT